MSDQAGLTGPFEIVEDVVDGVVQRYFAGTIPSLRALWDISAAHGDTPYLVYEDEHWTYTQAHAIVASLAHRLATEHGVGKGDRVAIAMRNYPEWAFSFWAISGLGAVVVPLNAWWTAPELVYGLSHSGSVVLIADQERLERVDGALGETSVRSVIAVRTPPPAGGTAFDDAAAIIPAAKLPDVEIAPQDEATIMYTSGTTGRPKGAVGTNRNICAYVMNAMWNGAQTAAAAAAAAAAGEAPPPAPALQPCGLLTFPLFHVGGLHSALVPYTLTGGRIVLMYKWDPAKAVELIERELVTALSGVPTTMFQALDEASKQGKSLETLTAVASGATLVPPELVRRIDEQFESRAAPGNGYGLTETSGAALANGGKRYLEHPDSVGKPISPVMEVRVAGPDGEPLPANEVGEIWLKGPTVIKGYYNNPEATAAAITDGWFHTGDAGRIDDEGFVYVVDRLKDVVIRGGENVYAAEVEAALYEHPDVAEAAIVGIPDPALGEAVAAVVRLRPGSSVDGPTLQAHVAARLAAFKVPSVVHLTPDELPRNAAGKVLKRELRDQLA